MDDALPAQDRRELEVLLAGVWKRVLGIPEVPFDKAFRDLGGDSLALVQVLHELRRLARIADANAWLPLPTVAEQAAYLATQEPEVARRLLATRAPAIAAETDLGHHVGREDIDRLAGLLASRPYLHDTVSTPGTGSRNPTAVFVLSSPRSGSTLLRVMLEGHSRLFSPPELNLLRFSHLAARAAGIQKEHVMPERARSGLGDALMAAGGRSAAEAGALIEAWARDAVPMPRVYAQLQAMVAPRLLVDKSPANSTSLQVLARAEAWFRNPLYIHLVRSPAAAVDSAEGMHLHWGFEKPGTPSWYAAETFWNLEQETVETFLASVPRSRWHLVRYEDLVRMPEVVMREVAAFLGVEFEETMVHPYDGRDRMTTSRYLEENPEVDRAPGTDVGALTATAAGDYKVRVVHSSVDPAMAEKSLRTDPALAVYTWRTAARYGYAPGFVAPRELVAALDPTETPTRRDAQGAGAVPSPADSSTTRESASIGGAPDDLEEPEAAAATDDPSATPPELPPEVLQRQRDLTTDWEGSRVAPDSLVFGRNTAGRDVPLFWCFQEGRELAALAHHLGEDQPLYGVRSGHRVMENSRATVAGLAAHYLPDLLRVHPEGPFLVGGNCQGAAVAWELAEQLARQGREVALVAALERVVRRRREGPVALFFGEESEYNPNRFHQDPEVGISRYYRGRLTIDLLPAVHGEFFDPPGIEHLAAGLRRRIDAALAARCGVTLPARTEQAQLEAPGALRLGPGCETSIQVLVRNPGPRPWPAGERSGLSLASFWLTADREMARWRDGKVSLPQDVPPEEEITLDLPVRAPEHPGSYLLVLHLQVDGMTRVRAELPGGHEVEVEVWVEDAAEPEAEPGIGAEGTWRDRFWPG
jgi:hypothetical protein